MACNTIWLGNGILFKYSGTVTSQEVEKTMGIMSGDNRVDTRTYQISDFTDVTNNLITPEDVKEIGDLDKSTSRWTSKKIRNAVITIDQQFIPIVEKYFRGFEGTAWECSIFDNLELAYEWVNRD
ncbi:MAG: hypothetical protein NTW10_00050 [Bacteroidetes bacterium]|nr:hypothetical protein [Bacteroidota bacterium]